LFKPEKGRSASLPVFSDGTHPTEYGGYVCRHIRRSLKEMEANRIVPQKHLLPVTMIKDNWEDALMLQPVEVAFGPEWERLELADIANLSQFVS
jgi:hypothetical protein